MRTEKDKVTCDQKVLYDTEFEAQLAVYKTEAHMGEAFRFYRCPDTKHFHISHVDTDKRNQARRGRTKCEKCHNFIRNERFNKHERNCK